MWWAQSGYNVASLATEWQTIPATLRSILATGGSGTQRLAVMIGSAANATPFLGGSTPETTVSGRTYGGGRIWVNTPLALVHELGHVAQTLAGQMQYDSTMLAQFARTQAHIDQAYAGTNAGEWLSESWCAQLGHTVILGGGNLTPTEAVWHRAISGCSQEMSVWLRMLWRQKYPDLPAFLAGKFDALPAASAPTVSASAIAYRWSDTARMASGDVLSPAEGYRIRGDGHMPIISGYPWPTFVWEQCLNGTWSTLSGTDAELIVSAPPVGTVKWRVTATNANGSVQSTTPEYTCLAPPVVTTNPSSGTYAQGATITLTAAATGATSQQWRASGVDIAGATGTTLTATAGAGGFGVGTVYAYCRFTNAAGFTDTNNATITVTAVEAPVFSAHPSTSDQSKALGASFNLSVSASGSPTYQWQRKLNGGSWVDLSGRVSSGLNLLNGSFSIYYLSSGNGYAVGDTAQFRCVATNAGGTTTSNPSGIITIT